MYTIKYINPLEQFGNLELDLLVYNEANEIILRQTLKFKDTVTDAEIEAKGIELLDNFYQESETNKIKLQQEINNKNSEINNILTAPSKPAKGTRIGDVVDTFVVNKQEELKVLQEQLNTFKSIPKVDIYKSEIHSTPKRKNKLNVVKEVVI